MRLVIDNQRSAVGSVILDNQLLSDVPTTVSIAVVEPGDDAWSSTLSVVPHPIAVAVTAIESGDDIFAAAITQPTGSDLGEPVTLAEAKLAARIDASITTYDNDVSRAITAARLMAEQITGRDFVRKTRRVTLKDWPAATDVLHVYEPVDVAISWWDGTTWQALDASAYAYWGEDAGTCIATAIGASWPTLGQVAGGARVRIDITAGPADPRAATPADVKLYIAAMVSHWHDNPGAMVAGNASHNPFIERLLDAACIYA